ncbi:MAG TPA: hypothetical protein VKE24_09630 [Candidatus Acidoferrales bacterium]|nr:hypothetical protein [Candidatus Acidoferrales bacterium]
MGQETTGTAKGYEKPASAVVTISIIQGSIVVDRPTIRLSEQEGHTATWQREKGGEFEVEFKNATPFDHFKFNQSDARAVKVRNRAPYGPYKYTVKVPGYPDLDPEVIVDQ